MKPFIKHIAATAVVASLSAPAMAEPTSEAVSITSLRPYSGRDIAYVYTSGNFCSQPFYSIDLSSNAGKAIYVTALAALAAGKPVKLEIAGGCGTGSAGSTLLQSIYILQ